MSKRVDTLRVLFKVIALLLLSTNVFSASYDEWHESVIFPYSLSHHEKEQLLSRYSEIEAPITELEVIEILGQPSYIISFYPKGSNEIGGNIYKYVIYKKSKESLNVVHDQYITLFFSPLGKLTSMHPKNLPELRELRFE